jgi:hypothetical protein
MIENGLISYDELKEKDHPLTARPLSELNLPFVESLTLDATIGDCLAYFKNFDGSRAPAIPIVQNKDDKKIHSVIFQHLLMRAILNKKLQKVYLSLVC